MMQMVDTIRITRITDMEEVFLTLMDIEDITHMDIIIIIREIHIMDIIIHMDTNIHRIRDVTQYNLEITILTINIEILMDFLINIDINMLIIILFLIHILIINFILLVSRIKDKVVGAGISIQHKDKELME